ncbi:MAG: 4'-phosphopantetheinyl transferase superfamily protein [Tannerellaceae bacterium]|jgi:phosphopantetheinyl transferase|nr:4'-phosphopantetheinyl transferase superfamily protein [Tannerellaceae bacterium]
MPLFLLHKESLCGVWKIEESSAELLSLLMRRDYPLLPEDIRTEKRKQEWLAVRVLLKELLGRETPVAYREDGAPYLPEIHIHLSISHTQGFAAVILNEQSPTGIDIEYLHPRIQKVRSRFMRPEEESMIDAQHETEHLLLCWCAKETLFKLMGAREVDFRTHLHIQPFAYKASGAILAAETRTPRSASYVLNYMVNKYFAMTWFREMTVVKCPLLLNSAIMVLLFLTR